MKRRSTPCMVVGALAMLVGCDPAPSVTESVTDRRTLTLYVAASLTDVMEEIGEGFSATHPVDLAFNFAGSGTLAQQILASSRADLFLSASEYWMDEVEVARRLLPGSRRTVCSNQLAVIANARSDFSMNPSAALADLPFKFLAIGDPDSVPAGRYAKEWLESLPSPDHRTVWNHVENRISPAPDVRAVLAQVEGSRDVIGVVYHTDYLARRNAVRLLHRVPVAAGPPIRYSVAVGREARSAELAQALIAYLTCPEAQAVFEKHGFTPITGTDTIRKASD